MIFKYIGANEIGCALAQRARTPHRRAGSRTPDTPGERRHRAARATKRKPEPERANGAAEHTSRGTAHAAIMPEPVADEPQPPRRSKRAEKMRKREEKKRKKEEKEAKKQAKLEAKKQKEAAKAAKLAAAASPAEPVEG